MKNYVYTWSLFCRQINGTAIVEFACILPILILLLLSGTEYGRASAVSRKVTLTTRAVADLTTQYVQMSNGDVSTVMNASAQIMSPYPASGLSIVLSEVTTDYLGNSTVTWSRSLNGTALTQGQMIVLPVGVAQPNSSVIISHVNYIYNPIFYSALFSYLNIEDQIYMNPRLSANVMLTGQ